MIYGLYPTYFDNGLSMLGVPQGYTFSIGTSLADVLSYYRLNNYKGKKIKNKDVIDALADGAVDFGKKGYDPLYGYGKIDIYNSLIKISKELY